MNSIIQETIKRSLTSVSDQGNNNA